MPLTLASATGLPPKMLPPNSTGAPGVDFPVWSMKVSGLIARPFEVRNRSCGRIIPTRRARGTKIPARVKAKRSGRTRPFAAIRGITSFLLLLVGGQDRGDLAAQVVD